MENVYYIQVLVPLRLEWIPVYKCAEPLAPGARVEVMFARRRYSGVVYCSGAEPGMDPSRIQDILDVQTSLPVVSQEELRFWEFLSSYYLCTLGEVFRAAYPLGKVRSEQKAASILERLRQRLAVRQESLSRKHKDNVRERLENEVRDIEAQITALTRVPDRNPSKADPGKPLLLSGGGRTEEYIKYCRQVVDSGLNVLILIPEIAAGEQLQSVFEQTFPGQVHCVNSRLTEVRRRRIADDIRNYGGQIVIGTRSSLFLPFSRLGLIIVENEHDALFKQTEPAPRYNARDAAVVLGRIHGARVVLGSPFPSLESLYNTQCGKYSMMRTGVPAASPVLVDINSERRKRGMIGRISRKLLEAASKTEGPVALVRGWEKADELLEEVKSLFPERQVDIYTVQQAALADLRLYSLVAVLQADALFPEGDFRADERALQALAAMGEQCSGVFLVQTAKADHPVFSSPEGITERLLEERKRFGLPPYTRLIDTDFGGHKERLTLASDNTLTARKMELKQRALAFEKKTGGRAKVIIDVDPI